MGSKKSTFQSSSEDFHKTDSEQQQLHFLLRHAILAPSGHNTQPWLFQIGTDYLDLFCDRTRGLPVVDPLDRELMISCGAILDHLQVTSKYYGRKLNVEKFPDSEDSDLIARIRLGDSVVPSESDQRLFAAIEQRRTTRTKFDDKPLTIELANSCYQCASELGLELKLVSDIDTRTEIAELVAEGDKIQFSDKRFRRELGSWVHSRRSRTRDGMSGSSFGMPDVLSSVGAMVIRTFDMGKGIAASDKEKVLEASPTLAIFSSSGDDNYDWLSTGECLSRVLLMLTTEGVTTSYLNQPIEVDELRPRLAKTVNITGIPQLLMRFGYGPTVPATVRRPVKSFLL